MIQRRRKESIVCCNQCGQVIKRNTEYTDYLAVRKSWGYFSKRDLQDHSFNLCETCYDHLIKGFKIPVDTKTNNEAI
ncbi:MAG: hypothetical protein H7X94_07545 [Vallitaleaceae bacterium]|nr:hypothetical protein [Vallitaleaceae bacterium]